MPKLKTLLNISLLLLFSLNLSCQDRMVNILYVLPKNYEGPIVVLYGQKEGKPKEYYNKDWRVYRINKDGTLRTQFEYERKSYLNMRFCYENKETKDWMRSVYVYEYPKDWTHIAPKPVLEANEMYLFGGSTNIHYCGLATYWYCGKSKDTIKQLINKYQHSYRKIDGSIGFMLIDNIIDSLRSPCK